MRIATPMSLIVVSMLRYDDDQVRFLGPFSSITAMDGTVTGKAYPSAAGWDHVTIVRLDAATGRWHDPAGKALVVWTAQSVDDAMVSGCREVVCFADCVRREFPADPDSVFAEDADNG